MGHVVIGTETQPFSVKLDGFPGVGRHLALLEVTEGAAAILPLLPFPFHGRLQLFDLLSLAENLRFLLVDLLLLLAQNLGGTGGER